MDNLLQNNEMQEEELYALLDKALETDPRLCVSEDLIQKTLKRAAEETDSQVISLEAAKKRRISPMKYVGVAAAAVFVVVLGVGVFGNGGFVAKDAQMEATVDNTAGKSDGAMTAYDSSEPGTVMANSADAQKGKTYYSRSGEAEDLPADDNGIGFDVLADSPKENIAESEAVTGGEAELSATTVTLSQKLAGVLKDAGMAPVSEVAECWTFADVETDWERDLLNSLAAGELWGNQCPESGSFRYVLEGTDSIQYVMEYNEPLDLIIRIETEQGALWGLFGAGRFWTLESFPQG